MKSKPPTPETPIVPQIEESLEPTDESVEDSWLKDAVKLTQKPKPIVAKLNPLPQTRMLSGSEMLKEGTAKTLTASEYLVKQKPHSQTISSKEENCFKNIQQKRYQIEREQGRGGIGRVWKVEDKKLERTIALKELLYSQTQQDKQRFLQEARITAKLEHPSIIPVHDLETGNEGTPYYTMKLVEGESFYQVISQTESLSQRLALLPHLIDAADAIAYAHSQDIIHRDLKPQNILLGEFGETIVVDWGLAKELGEAKEIPPIQNPYRNIMQNDIKEPLTSADTILGTPSYMPIEQAKGDSVDKRADVYALGAILYHLLSGNPPYSGKNSKQVLETLLSSTPTTLHELEPNVPRALLSIVNKAMARNKEHRYPSARDFAEELKRFQQGQLVASHPYSKTELLLRSVKKHLGIVIIACVALLLLITGGFFYYQDLQKSYQNETNLRILAQEEQQKAKQQEQKAIHSFAALLKEQGRQELLVGNVHKAAVLLSEAYQRLYQQGEKDEVLQFLLGDVTKSLDIPNVVLEGHINPVRLAKFSSDGTKVLTATRKIAKLWDARTGKELHTFQKEKTYITSAQFTPDGKHVVISTDKEGTTIWNTQDQTSSFTLEQNTLLLQGSPIVFSKGKSILFLEDYRDPKTNKYKNSIATAWSLKTGKKLFSQQIQFSLFSSQKPHIEFSPDGTKLITTQYKNDTIIWDPKTGKEILSIENRSKKIPRATFSPDGTQFLYLIPEKNKVEIRDVSLGKLQRTLSGHNTRIHFMDYTPDGNTIVTASIDNITKFWNVKTGKEIFSFTDKGIPNITTRTPYGGMITSKYKFSQDGRYFISAESDQSIKVRNSKTAKVLLSLHPPKAVKNQKLPILSSTIPPFSLSPDGQKVLSTTRDYRIIIWDLKNFEPPSYRFQQPPLPDNTFLLKDGSKISAISRNKYRFYKEMQSGEIVSGPTRTPVIQFTKDGSKTLSTSVKQYVTVWNTQTGKALFHLKEHTGIISSAKFSPTEEKIITASFDQTIKIWDANTGTLLQSFEEDGPVFYAEFIKDETKFVTLNSKNQIHIRDTSTGEILYSFKSYFDSFIKPRSCKKHTKPDKQTLAKNSKENSRCTPEREDEVISFFLSYLQGRKSSFLSLSPNGNQIAIIDPKTSLQIWNLHTGKKVNSLGRISLLIPAIQYSPDGTKILCIALMVPLVKILNAHTGKRPYDLSIDTSVSKRGESMFWERSIFFSQDGQKIIAVGLNRSTKIWDANTGKLLHELEEMNLIHDTLSLPNLEWILTINSFDNQVKLWDANTGKLLRAFDIESNIRDVRFSPDGSHILFFYVKQPIKVVRLLKETRSPEEVSKIVKEQVPWQLDEENGYLVPTSNIPDMQ